MIQSKMKWLLAFFTLIALFNACTPEDEKPISEFSNGVFIVNEGPFSGGSGTVDFFDRNKTLTTDLFAKANNGASLGSVLQSMTLYNGKAYFMLNNSNKIVVSDAKTFVSEGDVTTFNFPNFMVPIDKNRAYVSEWGNGGKAGAVKVFDFVNKSVQKTISTKKLGAGRMLLIGQSLWVLNDSGLSFPTQDSTVTVVDIVQDTVIRTIKVDESPNSIVQDANGEVWILCSKSLNKIKNNAVEFSIKVPDYSSKLTTDISKNNLYFVNGNKIYQKDLLNFGKNTPSVFLTQSYFRSIYALGFDPKSGYLFCGDAKDYKSSGTVYRFDATSKTLVDSLKVGIAPNGFIFQ